MGANQSDLSNAHYGYDFVVATTQESLNATMKEYLYNTGFPVVRMYWNQDSDGNPVPVSYEDLMMQTNGTDPLKVAGWNTGDPVNPDITNINNSNFYFAFEAAIGIPANVLPQNIPDIITLQQGTESVKFNLLCAEFTVVTCEFGRHGLTGFFNTSQPDDAFWLFTSGVELTNIIDNTNLPQAVQAQLNDFGPDAFSVQQLIFDFDSALLESAPQISGVQPDSPTYTALQQVFQGAYFSAMKAAGQPVLNYAIIKNTPGDDPSTLLLTDLEMEISPYIDPGTNTADDNNLNTLNYLCEVNGKKLPPPVPFGWNWVEKTDEANFDGIISINRNTFARYFENKLTDYVSQNCFAAYARVWLSGAFKQDTNYYTKLTPGQTPLVTKPLNGNEVLNYSYSSSAHDDAGPGGDRGAIKLSTTFSASVTFTGNTIVIVQNLLVTVYLKKNLTSETWNPVNKQYTDTYTLAVGQDGNLTANYQSSSKDNSQQYPKTSKFVEFFIHINDFTNQVDAALKSFVNQEYHDIPVNVAQQFIFPGGKTFTFKDVSFSDNQDLIAHISYA